MRIDITEWRRLPSDRTPARPMIAIGDIHGHADALEAMFDHFRLYIPDAYGDAAVDLVHLGDFVDRGPDPVGVLKLVREGIGLTSVSECAIMGNHDWYLVEAAELRGVPMTELDRSMWLQHGGLETLTALNLTPRSTAAEVREALGPEQTAMLLRFVRYFRTGDVLCVHAGVDPLSPLSEQNPHDLMWIREPFLTTGGNPNGAWPIDLTVVHGHTPTSNGIYPHRIGVDTGGFQTGVFSAIEMTKDGVRFHRVVR